MLTVSFFSLLKSLLKMIPAAQSSPTRGARFGCLFRFSLVSTPRGSWITGKVTNGKLIGRIYTCTPNALKQAKKMISLLWFIIVNFCLIAQCNENHQFNNDLGVNWRRKPRTRLGADENKWKRKGNTRFSIERIKVDKINVETDCGAGNKVRDGHVTKGQT